MCEISLRPELRFSKSPIMMLTMTVTAVVALFTQLSLGLTAAGTDGQRGLWHGLRHTPVPTLLDATLAELKHGLQHGSFNSTTLVSVGSLTT